MIKPSTCGVNTKRCSTLTSCQVRRVRFVTHGICCHKSSVPPLSVLYNPSKTRKEGENEMTQQTQNMCITFLQYGELWLIKYRPFIMVGLWCYNQSGMLKLRQLLTFARYYHDYIHIPSLAAFQYTIKTHCIRA